MLNEFNGAWHYCTHGGLINLQFYIIQFFLNLVPLAFPRSFHMLPSFPWCDSNVDTKELCGEYLYCVTVLYIGLFRMYETECMQNVYYFAILLYLHMHIVYGSFILISHSFPTAFSQFIIATLRHSQLCLKWHSNLTKSTVRGAYSVS